MEVKKTANYRYFRKIMPALRRNGNDECMASAIKFHAFTLLKCVQNGKKFEYRDELGCALISKLFFETIENYPKEKHVSNVTENYVWPVPPMPSEIFGDSEQTGFLRKQLFYKNIKVGDVLAAKVTSVTPVSYVLKVICKFSSRRVLDNLNIEVSMSRNKENLGIEKDLSKGDYCIVAVTNLEMGKDLQKIYVSMNENHVVNKGSTRKLGKISLDELPVYVVSPPDQHSFTTYAEYLHSSLAFRSCVLFDKLYADHGINIWKNHSFCADFSNLNCADEQYAHNIVKKVREKDIRNYLNKALNYRQLKDFGQAFENINVALRLDPKFIKSYEIRGVMHTEKDYPKESFNAYLDWCKIHELSNTYEFPKKQISILCFKGANKFYKSKNYVKAAELGQKALDLHPDNKEASALIEYLKKNHPESFLDSDENTLMALKEGLVAQLKELE